MPGPIKLTDFIQAAADLGPGRSLRLNLDRSGLVSSWGGLLVVLIRDRIFRDERQIIEEKRQVWGLFYAALKENHHDERADGIARHLAKEGLENLGGLKGAEIDRRTEGLPEKSDFPPLLAAES